MRRHWAVSHPLLSFSTASEASSDAAMSKAEITANLLLLKPSAFTGKPSFYEALFFLDDMLIRAQPFSGSIEMAEKTSASPDYIWVGQEKMATRLGFPLTSLQFRKLRARLNDLAPFAHIQEIRQFLSLFAVNATAIENSLETVKDAGWKDASRTDFVDQLGRAAAVGRRKTASARVWLVRGTGLLYVNGIPHVDYFPRLRDIMELAKPFKAAGRLGMYNGWALVKGGGISGQCGAVRHGIAKALAVAEPELANALGAGKLLKRDPRMVERKKPGQEKARKKFTWVKR